MLPPAHLQDYEIGDDKDLDDDDKENVSSYVFFADCDPTNKDGDTTIVYLYVDDLIFTGNYSKLLSEFKEAIIAQFEMTDMGLMSYFLGIEVKQTNGSIFISQGRYAQDVLKKFKLKACKPILTPVEERLKLVKDGSGDLVDATNFRRLVGCFREAMLEVNQVAHRLQFLIHEELSRSNLHASWISQASRKASNLLASQSAKL
ncbi:hypothetical protein GH714_026406 [Hevea brasiliensis]|uniref:Reverse transcriptase Ty1/copia-type domain-containing protein n=1 Tax=Hevea brasiliensis TaxID=3981 RepID=A0A6A6LM96_HEVBR|nr:hypothetical protein GH714_026406 [Hevea brasiliensis]